MPVNTEPQYMSCGGTLISSTHVLTAAHCVQNRRAGFDVQASQIKVYIGEHNRGKRPFDKGDSKFNALTVAEVIKHPNYNQTIPIFIKHPNYNKTIPMFNHDNDYAILRLSKAVDFTSEVTPACLPADVESTYEGRIATATGWGLLGDPKTSKTSTSLQEVNVTVTSNYECNKLYGKMYSTSIMICAGGYGRGTRPGDSGGPLIVVENDRHTLVITLNNYLGSKLCFLKSC